MIVLVIKLVYIFINNITSWFIKDFLTQIKGHKFKVVERISLDSFLTSVTVPLCVKPHLKKMSKALFINSLEHGKCTCEVILKGPVTGPGQKKGKAADILECHDPGPWHI